MRLPNLSNSSAVWIIAVGLTIVTWLMVLTAKVPNPPPPPKSAPQTTTTPAAPAETGAPVTYVDMNYDKPSPATVP